MHYKGTDKRIDQTHLWAETYERALADVFAIQSEVAARIATSLAVELLPAQQAALARSPTTNPAAYEAGLAPFQWTVSRLSFSTSHSRRCGNCGSRVAASKRLWESRSDFQGLVSFHNG